MLQQFVLRSYYLTHRLLSFWPQLTLYIYEHNAPSSPQKSIEHRLFDLAFYVAPADAAVAVTAFPADAAVAVSASPADAAVAVSASPADTAVAVSAFPTDAAVAAPFPSCHICPLQLHL